MARELPLILCGPDALAAHEGRMTEVRRPMRPQPSEDWQPASYGILQRYKNGSICEPDEKRDRWGACNEDGDEGYFSPFGAPGDRLWVRETWWHEVGCDYENAGFENGTLISKRGGVHRIPHWGPSNREIWKKRTPVSMPRWASRTTLEVLDVWAEPGELWQWACKFKKVEA